MRSRRSWRVAVLMAGMAAVGGLTVGTAAAEEPAPGGTPQPAPAADAEPALVHASPANECKLNVRSGPDVSAPALTTLTCENYTTCAESGSAEPCAPYVTGGQYSCVGADGTQVTDDRWAEVTYRAPERAYVAVACAAFRE